MDFISEADTLAFEGNGMTDPTFETRGALEAWNDLSGSRMRNVIERAIELQTKKESRVRAAHAHLLKGQNDG